MRLRQAVAAEMVIALRHNDGVDKGTPADGTHQVIIVWRDILESAEVQVSFLHHVVDLVEGG